MDNRLKESISALLDNEADELELRRVLSQTDSQEVNALWGRYNKVSDLLSSGRHSQETFSQDGCAVEDGFLTIDISAQISQAINEEGEQVVLEPETLTASQLRAAPKIFNAGFLSRMAVAAAVVLSVLLVFKPFDSRVAVNVDSQVAAVALPVDESLSSDLSVAVVEKPFTPEHARRLNEYLLRHAENSVTGGRSGLMPLARVASFTNADN